MQGEHDGLEAEPFGPVGAWSPRAGPPDVRSSEEEEHERTRPGRSLLGDVKERDAFAWAFDKIIGEARATRIFVDKAGAPVARSEPKKRLRMILGAH